MFDVQLLELRTQDDKQLNKLFNLDRNLEENDVNNLNVYNIQTKQWVKGFQQKKQLEQ